MKNKDKTNKNKLTRYLVAEKTEIKSNNNKIKKKRRFLSYTLM